MRKNAGDLLRALNIWDCIAWEVPVADRDTRALARPSNLAENLVRKELTKKERDAHTTLYAALLKKSGAVVDGKKASGMTRTKMDPNHSGPSAQTTTRMTAEHLGIDDDTVRNRIRNAATNSLT